MDKKQAEKNQKIEEVASEIMALARDHILMHMRFMDIAVSAIRLRCETGLEGMSCDGTELRYDPLWIIRRYKKEQGAAVRAYLHVLLHLIFSHSFQYDKVDHELWNLAADMAVEHTIMELGLPGTVLRADARKKEVLEQLKKEQVGLTAEKLYRHYRKHPMEPDAFYEQERLFHTDDHEVWMNAKELTISLADWKKISERMKADLKTFSKGKTNDSLEENLSEATRDKVDYEEFLRRFVVSGEAIHVNDDEFDYIYYTYGLEHYGNMPLVEPLEYQEVQKVHDFVIAIDTSASCRGGVVRAFLNRTYSIMKSSTSFFEDMNVHILQCDNEVRSDVKITNEEEFDEFIADGKLTGFGSTDFRPVFERVEELRRSGEIRNLKGLIYFTDGFGIFPQKVPDYDAVFVFLDDDDRHPPLPHWAIKVVLTGDDIEETDTADQIEDEVASGWKTQNELRTPLQV